MALTKESLITLQAEAAASAKEAAIVAENAWKDTSRDTVELFLSEQITTVVTADGHRVTVVVPTKGSVSYDIDALAEAVPAAVLKAVTKTVLKVDPALLAAAVNGGLITAELAESITKVGDAPAPYAKVVFHAVDTEEVPS